MYSIINHFRPYARVLLAFWVILIIVLAVMSDINVPRVIRGRLNIRLDYPIHFLEHTSLAILAMISFINIGFRQQSGRALRLLGFLILFAIFTEMLQLMVPSRTFEFRDMGLNIMGSIFGTLITMILYTGKKDTN